MDYNLNYALTFNCSFCYDFISIFSTRTQYMIHDEKKNGMKKLQQKL
jgi:hypothetical protein